MSLIVIMSKNVLLSKKNVVPLQANSNITQNKTL